MVNSRYDGTKVLLNLNDGSFLDTMVANESRLRERDLSKME